MSPIKRIIFLLITLFIALSLTVNAAAENDDVNVSESAASFLLTDCPVASFGEVNGDWEIICFSAAEKCPAGKTYFDFWYSDFSLKVTELGGILHKGKYTEYSRAVLAATAAGRDARNIGGYDLTAALFDFEKTTAQGVNGAAWALIALDSGNYPLPGDKDATMGTSRQSYITFMLSRELDGGGWALGRTAPDCDITAMVIQALADYTDIPKVKMAVERGISKLSAMQQPDGGFAGMGNSNSESCSQVICALCKVGIPLSDSRFIKDGNSVFDALMRYRNSDGGFAHLSGGESNSTATQQAFLALTAIERLNSGKRGLYYFDGVLHENETEPVTSTLPASEIPRTGEGASLRELSFIFCILPVGVVCLIVAKRSRKQAE